MDLLRGIVVSWYPQQGKKGGGMKDEGLVEKIASRAVMLNGYGSPISELCLDGALCQVWVDESGRAFTLEYPFGAHEEVSLDAVAHAYWHCGGDVRAVKTQLGGDCQISKVIVILAAALHGVFYCQRNGASRFQSAA